MTTETMQPESRPAATTAEQQADPQDVKPVVENTKDQSQNATQQPQKPQKSRHRASVACASCRDRRIRVCPLLFAESRC